jgi:hypothetical protein
MEASAEYDVATGRPFNPIERTMFAAAARDDAMARHVYGFASRQFGPVRFLSPAAIARAASVSLRRRSDAAVRPDSAVAA